jgi:hypothetical protein
MPLSLGRRIVILATDESLAVVGDPIGVWDDLDITLRFNEPGSGSFTVPRSADLSTQLAPGNRIMVIRDGSIFAAGPIEFPGPQTWSATGADAGSGRVKVAFAEDLALVCGRITYPDPAHAITAQTAAKRTFTATNAETICRTLVDENAGPGALAARQIPGLALGSVASVGSSISFSTRCQPLGDELRSVAIQGGGFGIRTRQSGSSILFECYATADLTGLVRFGRGLGNLRSYAYENEAPKATVAIVGDGSGTGTSRVFRERTDSAAVSAWWRLETMVDRRDTTTTAELDQAGDEALVDGAETARLTAEVIDTPDQAFGTAYGLGDQVTVELETGVEVADVVRAVRLTASPRSGELVQPVIGTQQATTDQQVIQLLRAALRRLDRLEAI